MNTMPNTAASLPAGMSSSVGVPQMPAAPYPQGVSTGAVPASPPMSGGSPAPAPLPSIASGPAFNQPVSQVPVTQVPISSAPSLPAASAPPVLPATPADRGPGLAELAQKLSSWKTGVMNAPATVSSTALPALPVGSPAYTNSSMPGSPAVPVQSVSPASGQSAPTLRQVGPPKNLPPVEIKGTASSKKYPYTIEDLLQLVVDKNASDLHITTNYPAMIRIDGSLVPVGQEVISDEIVNDVILPVLPESKQELLEVNREVDLAYSFKGQARFRINAFYSKGTVSAAFRLIPNKIRNIEELKLPGTYHQLTKLPQGLVLVTGPTGHGKSTTLAAILQEINETYPKHIITIEDPIEYVYPKARALVAQREMHEDTHSWEIALRSAMREDPNVILVGEMRDYETIAAAITLAETGHLVFATLHTNSSAQTIDRIIDVFPEHQQPQVRMQLSVILEAIISQRLIPVKSGGRRAASEVLFATGAVRNLIREGKTHQVDNVIRTSLDVGMKTLEHSLVDLVREGEITIDEAESVALHPEELVRLLRV